MDPADTHLKTETSDDFILQLEDQSIFIKDEDESRCDVYGFIYDRRGDSRMLLDGHPVERGVLINSYLNGHLLRVELDVDYGRYGHIVEARFFSGGSASL